MIHKQAQPELSPTSALPTELPTVMVVGSGNSLGVCFRDTLNWCLTVDGHMPQTITTNAGLIEFLAHPNRGLRPDRYYLGDAHAIELFGRYANTARNLGTQVITRAGCQDWLLRQHGLSGADQRLDLAERDGEVPSPEVIKADLSRLNGTLTHPRLSGLICLALAARQIVEAGGGKLVLVGFDGYASTPTDIRQDTFDGRMGKTKGASHTANWIKPYCEGVFAALDELTEGHVEIVLVGKRSAWSPTPRASVKCYATAQALWASYDEQIRTTTSKTLAQKEVLV